MNLKTLVLRTVAPPNETARNGWVIRQLQKIPEGMSILDIGAGEMPYKEYCKHLKYKSQDFGKYTGENVQAGIKTGKYNTRNVDIISDIKKIPVGNKSFDYVLCTEVFEHIPDPLGALKEIERICRRGLIITAPFASLTHFYPYFFYTGFSEQFYKINLPNYGFKIKDIYRYGNYYDLLGMEFLRLPLIVFEERKYLLLVLLPFVILGLPLFMFTRVLSNLFPYSSDIFCFGVCVSARKLS